MSAGSFNILREVFERGLGLLFLSLQRRVLAFKEEGTVRRRRGRRAGACRVMLYNGSKAKRERASAL